MDKLSLILLIIGCSVLVFSVWSFIIIKKHIRRFNNNHRHSSSLSDEKYFELKSRQDYIISSSAIIFAVISFIGYSSLKEIRESLSESIAAEQRKLNSLYSEADTTYSGLQIRGRTYEDSIRQTLKLVEKLRTRISLISNKDVIQQNIFIVDPLLMGSYKMQGDQFRIVYFKDLETISGQRLPIFKQAPSIVCFSTTFSMLLVKDVTTASFKIRPEFYLSDDNGESVKFSLWISQKPQQGSFSDDFSPQFK